MRLVLTFSNLIQTGWSSLELVSEATCAGRIASLFNGKRPDAPVHLRPIHGAPSSFSGGVSNGRRESHEAGGAAAGLEKHLFVLDRLPQAIDKDLATPGPSAAVADPEVVRLE